MLTNRSYASRAPNQKLKDLNRVSEGLVVSVNQLKRSKDLIVDAIDRGFVRDVSHVFVLCFSNFLNYVEACQLETLYVLILFFYIFCRQT